MPRMENARECIDAPDDAALAGADGALHAGEPVAAPVEPEDGSPLRQAAGRRADARPTEAARRDLHASFNYRISYLCKLAALVIAVVAFATIALGQEIPKFVLMGLCLSVALLAIAMLQDHNQRKQ